MIVEIHINVLLHCTTAIEMRTYMFRFFRPVLSVIALNAVRTVASDGLATYFFPLGEASNQVNNKRSSNISPSENKLASQPPLYQHRGNDGF